MLNYRYLYTIKIKYQITIQNVGNLSSMHYRERTSKPTDQDRTLGQAQQSLKLSEVRILNWNSS